jgi:hypothetical protein
MSNQLQTEFLKYHQSLLILTISNTETTSLSKTLNSIALIASATSQFAISTRVILSSDSSDARQTVASYAYKYDLDIISTKDLGISDALNIGLRYVEAYSASYSHFLFLHAGDVFSDPPQVSNIFNQIILFHNDSYAAYYGATQKGSNLQKCYPFNMSTISGINHWGFVQTVATARLARFQLKYKVAMDYDYILCLLRKGVILREYDKILVIADPAGLSRSFNRQIRRELDSIYRDHFYQEIFIYAFLQHLRSLKAFIKTLGAVLFPRFLHVFSHRGNPTNK